MTHQIIQSIKSFVRLNEAEEQAFLAILEVKNLKRKRFYYKKVKFAIKLRLSIAVLCACFIMLMAWKIPFNFSLQTVGTQIMRVF